ncbi:hypothetical protein V6S65_09800 [Lactococcus lactis]|uniref:hypothetical protein n=1 Tax=Lactococcus lactis TaxID=1358 RepID=UPI00207C57CC|nr:hypothetical protein [Lactococcus lactis]MCO0816920.1 hypothetical protein [Lactococcus lactis]MCT0045392.1 hypothetical protein [Lactococcus lactis subsp. lactis]MDN5447290.1 hypothetical protein [Lactococcus lactis]
MSELEKTAPNEIYLIVGDTDKDCNFNELSEVTWADMPIYEETAIKYVKSSQLTIPKSIADLLDKFIEFYFDDVGHEDWWIQENGLIEWFSKTPNCYIKDAYLAGKALGVDLVKVVEG